MKKQLLSFLLALVFSFSYADGWRKDEMQIKIQITSQQQITKLNSLNINYEVADYSTGEIRAFVTPNELQKLQGLNMQYQVEIDNLNEHFKNFWLTEDSYHSYQQIIDLADSLETEFPEICKKYSFGTDASGQYDLVALKISDNVLTDEPEAEVMFDAGIHGDEIGGPENVIRFARDLCIGYGDDPTITNLIDNREIWLYLMVNPWGRENMSRYNTNGVDMNRDWGYMWDGWGSSTGAYSQPEVKALRECMYNNQFVVHTTYHSGTVYISLPWSYRSSSPPDWNHINQLGGVYSNTSNYPNLPYGQGNTGMYAINGSSKDSNYGVQGSISWSMEISDNKQPPASQIMTYYNYNYPAMIAMIEYSGYGLQGTVTDANTGEPVTAVVFVNDYMQTYTDPTAGDYHKYVLPGTYSIKIVANGYETQTIDNVTVTANNATNTDFQLVPEDGQYVYKFSSSRIPDNNEADEGNTKAVIGAPDNINYSIGKNGWCVLDMQFPVVDGPGPDLIVYEGDTSPEGFTCYAGSTIDGPWISLGTGNGTTEFDIAESGLPEAQFFKILDDGDGSANVADAGFDLDAIEALEPVSGVYLAMYDYTVDDSNGNNNGKIDPGETVDLIVTLKNNGDVTAESISGEISTTSPYLTIDSGTADFGTLAQSETGEGTFTVTASSSTPAGQPAGIDLDVTSNSGTYTNSFAMNFVIGQIPVVIIDLDENHNSGPAMQVAIEDNGLAAEYTTSFPSSLDIYSSIFVCLGIYSDNHTLSASEGQALADFLNNGGALYMEGGDTWYYDAQTAVHPMFNIDPQSDGSNDLSTINGQPGTFTEDMSFNYSGDNSWVDHIEAISPAYLILQNNNPSYGTAVAYDEGSYKTIGASHEFGGLDDDTSPSTKEELMAEYLNFFGLNASLQASFSASTTDVCEEETVDFSDLSTGDVTSWDWTFEGGTPETSTLENPTVMYYNTGSFDVSLTVSDGTNTSTLTLEDYITVNTTPEIPAMPEGETVVCSNNPEMLTQEYTTAGSAGAETYEWLLEPAEAGEITGNGTTATVNYTEFWEGDVTISVKAVNDCGESDFSESLSVECYVCEGIEEDALAGIRIYPNPNNGSFVINMNDTRTKNKSIKIYNSTGEVVFEQNDITTGSVNISLGETNPGLYYVIIKDDKAVVNKKIVVK